MKREWSGAGKRGERGAKEQTGWWREGMVEKRGGGERGWWRSGVVERGIVQQTRRYVRACGSRAEWKREEEVRGREEEGGACDPRFK